MMEASEKLDIGSIDDCGSGDVDGTIDGDEVIVESGEAADGRLDKWLAEQLPQFSRSFIRRCFDESRITLLDEEPRAVRPRDSVKARASYRLIVPPLADARPQPEPIPLRILFEDEHLLVIDKDPGMVVHPSAGHPSGTLVNALLAHCGDSLSGINGVRRPGILHRLDRDTTGVILVAKNDAAHRHLADQLQHRTLRREYAALVQGEIEEHEGTIETFLGRDPRQRLRRAVVSEKQSDARHATTHWKTEERFHGAALLRCRLETGRTHQIRVHLAHQGHPVLGDTLYGFQASAVLARQPTRFLNRLRGTLGAIRRQMLHARLIRFVHPASGDSMEITSELPPDMTRILEAFREAGGV